MVGGETKWNPLAQGKRPVQVRAKIFTDGGDHDENDKKKRKCDQNWLWLPTCNIRSRQLPKEKYLRPGWLGPYEKTKKDERQSPEMQKQNTPAANVAVGVVQTNTNAHAVKSIG